MTYTTRRHIVRRGETLSLIARRHHTSVRALARHNGIQNINLIRVGQRLLLPSTAPYHPNVRPSARPAAPGGATGPTGGTTRMSGGTLSLSATDVLNIKKTLQTEWVPSGGDAQAYGIIDTILNRTASGHWGRSIADVVNAYKQFSDINGPIAWKHGHNSVDGIAASRVSRRVDQLVDGYLAERAAGRASAIGTHLSYANPHFSDAKNLPWIMALDGPVLGRGNAIHRHGTTPELQRFRPAPFKVALGGGGGGVAGAPAPMPARPLPGRRVDGNALAAANGVGVKTVGVRIGQLDPAMEAPIRAVAGIARSLELPAPVITSGNDSHHKRGSLHYADRALDFRGNNITVAQGRAFQDAMRQSLGNRYDIQFEVFPNNSSNNHLHVEYDPD